MLDPVIPTIMFWSEDMFAQKLMLFWGKRPGNECKNVMSPKSDLKKKNVCVCVKEFVYLQEILGSLQRVGHHRIIFQWKVTGLLLLDPLTEEIPFSGLT